MNNTLQIETAKEDSTCVLTFRGTLNEKTKIDVSIPSDYALVFDLEHLTRINSGGILVWKAWIRNLPQGSSVAVRRVHPSLIKLASLIPELFPKNWNIESFYVPYINSSDLTPEKILFSKGTHFSDHEVMLPARITSSISDTQLEIDVYPEGYFRFLQHRIPNLRILSA